MNRDQKARELALRRRAGASKEHSAKVKAHMLAQADLETTCQTCHKQVTGTLDTIRAHVEACNG